MFDRIAPSYDRVNRLLSFGRDIAWRKKVRHLLPNKNELILLDLATGTGDQLISLDKSKQIAEGVGVDMSTGMLEVGQKKLVDAGLDHRLELREGDATDIPYEEHRFDVVTISFGIRNVVHVDKALSEMHRVLKPGGRALILEFSLPPNPVIAWLHLFYLRHILPLVGGMVSGDTAAYRYLNTTIESFPYGEAFCKKMRDAGFSETIEHRLTFGVATIYEGIS